MSQIAVPVSSRKRHSCPDLDRAELDWWDCYADVEDRYCWVQTPTIQRFLRGDYVRRIIHAADHKHVLEVGCGSGWLCLLLARLGAASVEGIDPSAAQIERAAAAAREARLSERVQFRHGSLPGSQQSATTRRCYDVLVLHAVLHHLSDEEIHELLTTFAEHLANPGARVFIVEPVSYRRASEHRTTLDRVIDRLILLPRAGRKLGWRRYTPEEQELTNLIDARGDSPKEGPFEPGELERLLGPNLIVRRSVPVLNFSYLGAKNALLLGLSHPLRARLLLWPYLWVLRYFERIVLKLPPGATWLPLFELFECQVPPVP